MQTSKEKMEADLTGEDFAPMVSLHCSESSA